MPRTNSLRLGGRLKFVVAMLVASIRAATKGLLARFDPKELANRLGGDSMFDSFLPANKKSRQWESFVELYADVCVEAEQDFWAVFEKELKRAYAAQDRTLAAK